MPDFRPILFAIGALLATLALAMLLPAAVEAAAGNDDWQVFATASALTAFVGITLVLSNRDTGFQLTLRQAFLLTTLSWLTISLFGAVPFMFSRQELSLTDAFFESMSGITTTGSTVMTGLDDAAPGILLWRALLQWLGGIGIIVLSLTLLPMLRVGGMQLFRTESSEKSDKALPRAAQLGGGIAGVYGLITLAAAFAYAWANVPWFDAFAHAMTTVATGGYSTSDGSIAAFGPRAEWVAAVFMAASGLPFMLYLRVMLGQPGALLRDSQVRMFFGVLAVLISVMGLYAYHAGGLNAGESARAATVNVISIMTGTGYTTLDYGAWGSFAVIGFLTTMFIGGCAGSTSCGIKVFRFQVMFQAAHSQVLRLQQPHRVTLPHFNGKPLSPAVVESVLNFFFLFLFCFFLAAVGLALTGVDVLTAISGAATALCNVGPGLGDVIGPRSTFTTVPDAAKWILAFAMLLGRLELFTVLVLLNPNFWRA